MREREQWVVWRYEHRAGQAKPTKVLYVPGENRRAKSTDPATWRSFDAALSADGDGLGFVFSESDPFTGVDLDGAIGADGQLEPWAQDIVTRLDSYTELSPSGHGVHVIIGGTVPGPRRRKGPVEMYSSDRFFTVTGRRLESYPATVEVRQAQLAEVYSLTFPDDVTSGQPIESHTPAMSDEAIIELMRAAGNADRVRKLWNGDRSDYATAENDGASEADAALASWIAFYTQDPVQVERIMRRSKLVRPKWNRASYMRPTVESAIRKRTQFYAPPDTTLLEKMLAKHGQAVGAGSETLDHVRAFIAKYTRLPGNHYYDVLTLWAAHTHAIMAFGDTPRLILRSAEKESGKTRTLEILELLVAEPLPTFNATPAAIFRWLKKHQATLLLDEVDAIFGRAPENTEDLRALLNAGYHQGAYIWRCVGEGAKLDVEQFPAYGAAAMAGIGRNLPDTIVSRGIVIPMRRRLRSETIAPFRRKLVEVEVRPLRDSLAAWVGSVADNLPEFPTMPDGVADRAADIWTPLIAIADAAGGEWPTRARTAAVAILSRRLAEDDSLGVQLLKALRTIFGKASRLPSARICSALNEDPEGLWGSMYYGRGLTEKRLADMLKPYLTRKGEPIQPKPIRFGDKQARGYVREDFTDAWERYL